MSGLSRTPGKRVRGKTLRGFESRPLRQRPSIHAGHRAKPRLYPSSDPSIERCTRLVIIKCRGRRLGDLFSSELLTRPH